MNRTQVTHNKANLQIAETESQRFQKLELSDLKMFAKFKDIKDKQKKATLKKLENLLKGTWILNRISKKNKTQYTSLAACLTMK